ncbi:MAG: ATP synthase F1 subunit gamma [Clostridia bacterium]|nr:ATP synthase F1 subunit gamma [Clostridia bacterium]MDD4798654.1 ATP synthase F1 subunit gamma [Clostridia bacterium]
MASARDIKRRIKSVKSTQQITKAMKMVSAAKLRKAQIGVSAVRPYAKKMEEVISDFATGETAHVFLEEREVKKVAYIVIAGDRALCGGYNGNALRYAEKLMNNCEHEYGVIAIGSKARDYFARRDKEIIRQHLAIGDVPGFSASQIISKEVAKLYLDGEIDEVQLVFTEFKSAMTHIPSVMQLLPVPKPQGEEESQSTEYIYEPNSEEILNVVLPQYVDVSLFRAIMESKASEHGARMTAMSSATDNAKEMISKLTLSLNRARQAAITTEITEVVGGAAALS